MFARCRGSPVRAAAVAARSRGAGVSPLLSTHSLPALGAPPPACYAQRTPSCLLRTAHPLLPVSHGAPPPACFAQAPLVGSWPSPVSTCYDPHVAAPRRTCSSCTSFSWPSRRRRPRLRARPASWGAPCSSHPPGELVVCVGWAVVAFPASLPCSSEPAPPHLPTTCSAPLLPAVGGAQRWGHPGTRPPLFGFIPALRVHVVMFQSQQPVDQAQPL